MRSRICNWALALAALIGFAPAAMAQSGFYVFGTVGYTDQSAGVGDFNVTYGLAIPPTADVAGISESETAYKLGVGYRINQYFAVEGSWGRLGDVDYSVIRPGAFGGTFLHTIEPEVLQLAVVGIFPVSKEFEVFAKAGVASIDNKGAIVQTGGLPPFGICGGGIVCQAGTTADDTVGVFGLGLTYSLQQSRLFVRAEFEYYPDYKVATVPNLRPVFGPFAQAGGDIKIDSKVFSIGLGSKF